MDNRVVYTPLLARWATNEKRSLIQVYRDISETYNFIYSLRLNRRVPMVLTV